MKNKFIVGALMIVLVQAMTSCGGIFPYPKEITIKTDDLGQGPYPEISLPRPTPNHLTVEEELWSDFQNQHPDYNLILNEINLDDSEQTKFYTYDDDFDSEIVVIHDSVTDEFEIVSE